MTSYTGNGGPFIANSGTNPLDPFSEVFVDRTARDSFYAIPENLAGLAQNETTILILNDGTGDSALEVWLGATAPASYANTEWGDITPANPSATTIKTLYESNPNTEGLPTGKLAILNTLDLMAEVLRSTNPVSVNDILYWGPPETDLSMRARRLTDNGHLVFERREASVWNEKFRVSDSLSVDVAHLTETLGPVVVPEGDICLYNARIRNSAGVTILRPFFTNGTDVFPLLASLPGGEIRAIQNLAEVLADPTTVNAVYKFVTFNEDLATVAKSGSYNDLADRPTIPVIPTLPVPRTDEEIQDVIGATMVEGMGVSLVYDDDAGTLTISATGDTGGGTPPPASADIILYGLSPTNNPSTVDPVTLTEETDPTNPDTIATGVASQGDFFILLVPQADDITSIFDTVLNQPVTDIFTETDNVRAISAVSYKSYVIGPLNAGVNETYVINF